MAKDKVKKPFFKRVWVWVVGIIVLIVIAANLGSGGSDTASTDTKADTTSKTAVKDASKKADDKNAADQKEAKKKDSSKKVGVGESATIADVTFTVDKVNATTEIKPDNDIMEPAKAGSGSKFIVLHVTIKNGQKKALNIISDYFKLKTEDGTTYSPSTDGNVLMAIPTDQQIFLKQINPGITKDGTIVYNVPKDLKLSNLYVHCQTGFWGTETVDISLEK